MSSVGFRVDEEQVAEMVKVADSNNTGTIELNEFLNLMVG
jgi:Ca2+-binding EF-hand superfamily protein